MSVFTLYPIIASLYYSFCDYSVLTSAVWTGGDNYGRLMHDALFWISLKNTLIYATFSIPLGLIVSLALAMLLNCEARGTSVFRTIFYLPTIVPLVASSMLWLWIFNGSFGLMNWALGPVFHLFGQNPPGWLADPRWSKPALILMSLWSGGNSMIIYLAGLQDVPKELYEAAEIDGAGVWRRLWHITIPMITPVIYFNLIMGIIGTLQIFTQVYVMMGGAGGSPARSTLFYALYLFATAFHDMRMGYASAMAWILFVIIVALTLLATKWMEKKTHYTR
jgi:multiple sugar transport system permease protein